MRKVLLSIAPNMHGPDRWYAYEGNPDSLQEIQEPSDERPDGWLVAFRDVRLARHRVVVFAENDQVFLDVGRGPRNVSAGEVRLVIRRLPLLSLTRLIEPESDGAQRFAVFTPPWRYLTNDGMFFPEGVCPFSDCMQMLSDEQGRRRLLKALGSRRATAPQ